MHNQIFEIYFFFFSKIKFEIRLRREPKKMIIFSYCFHHFCAPQFHLATYFLAISLVSFNQFTMIFFPYTKWSPLFKRAFLNRSYYVSYATYAAAGFLILVYITEWKRFARYVPGLSSQIKSSE